MAMRTALAGRLLRRSATAAQQWRSLSASAPEQPQQAQHSHQFAHGLRRASGSLGLGFKGLESSANGAGVTTGKRFFGASSVVQQHSLVTPNEVQKELQSGADTGARTAELVAQTREMQLKSINEARARIFGHVIGNGERSAHKVLRRKMIGQKIVSWYPTPIQKQDPMFEDPKIKRRVVKNERLKRRGKGPPKKGHGKRAAKRAK
ncbi:hypothetical protein M758_10G068200 [Ceratodon purpureus]|nr:hypothetical protein M758_10G068200 [Ceratodon purpureus]